MKADSAWNPSDHRPGATLWREAAPYLLSLALVLLTLLARFGLGVAFGERPLLILFVFPIIVSAHVGGLGPGLAATFLAAASVAYFLVPPTYSFYIARAHDLAQWLMLVVSGVLVSALNEALRRSRKRVTAGRQTLAAALVGMADALITSDASGRVELLNPEAQRLTGWSQAEAQGQPLSEVLQVLDDEEQRPLEELIPALLRGGNEVLPGGMVLLKAWDGSLTPISLSSAPIRDEAGLVTGLVLTFRDRSAEREAQRELRLWADAFRFSAHGMAIGLPGSNTFLACNAAFARMLGRKVGEMAGLPILTIYDPADRERVAQCFAECDASGQVRYEASMLRADGTSFPVQIDLVSVRDGQGGLRYRVSSAQDITLRRQEDARLESLLRISQLRADSEQELLDCALTEALALTNSSLGYIFHYREDEEEFQLNTWSARVVEQCQVNEPQEVSQLAHTGIWAEMLQQRAPLVLNDLQNPHSLRRERPAGHVRLERLCTIPVFLDEELIAVAAVANKPVDYTAADLRQLTLLMDAVWKFLDRLRALQGLKESEARFQALVENAPDAIFIQTDQRFAYANQAALRLFGVKSDDQLLDQPVLDRFHPSDRSHIRERIRRLNQDRQAGPMVEERCLRLDGSSVDVEVSAVPFQYQGREGALVFLRDVSERKRARDTLEASEKRLHTILEAIADPVVVYNALDQISFVNPAFSRVFGWRPEEVLGRRAPLVPPEQQEQADLLFSGLLAQGGIRGQEAKLVAKNGEVRNVMISAAGIPGPDGDSEGLVVNFSDVSLTRRLEAQLRQSQKMEAIGTLAGGIAHDFNNILTSILNSTELALLDLPEKVPARVDLERVVRAAHRGSSLVKQILTFSRPSQEGFRATDLAAVIREAVGLVRASMPRNIVVVEQLEAKNPYSYADPVQIQQIVLNCVTNAFQALREIGGRIEIGLTEEDLDQERAKVLSVQPGRYIRLSIADNGPGIAQDIRDKIFDPFFTTKDKTEGTGLGLAVAHGIVQVHKGAIRVSSRPFERTAFDIYLPCFEDSGERPAEDSAAAPGQGERILFVEDDEDQLETIPRVLTRLGYAVTAHRGAAAALETLAARPDGFDCLVTDYDMPEINGLRLAEEAARLAPGLPVILVSGRKRAAEAQGESAHISKLVLKPYDGGQITRAIREVLSGQGPEERP